MWLDTDGTPYLYYTGPGPDPDSKRLANNMLFVITYMATEVFIGKLWATCRMSIDPNDERGSWINKSVNTGVHLTVHLMHPNYCHVTLVVVLLLPYIIK